MNATEQPPAPDGPSATPGTAQPAAPADRLARAVDRLVAQVGHWQPGRWTTTVGTSGPEGAGGDGTGASRGDRVYALIQRLADLSADAERRPHLAVPRLGELVLPDQLRVVADDLIAAGAPAGVVTEAAADIEAVRRAL